MKGLLFVDPATYQSIPPRIHASVRRLPASADLSTDFPTPGNQGAQGSCVDGLSLMRLKVNKKRRNVGGGQMLLNAYSVRHYLNKSSDLTIAARAQVSLMR